MGTAHCQDDGMVHYIVLDFETDFGEGIFGPDEVVGRVQRPPDCISRPGRHGQANVTSARSDQ